ncbi:SAM dependent carboxyl methyltransferase [Dillenia turbinata]|uniref:SAM dependent carboxyl methyltransferase n=1 Tax=Dillenia turbinata TaxID=194707 RepID=A0AAN8UVV5_9MAGN
MNVEGSNVLIEANAAMNGGDGPQSYSQNSFFQKTGLEAVKEILQKEIRDKFDVVKPSPSESLTVKIADFGCSTGPNTFHAVQIILEAIQHNLQSETLDSQGPEFQVFFNDLVTNDFNTLFASLPPKRQYYAAAVPGSFYDVVLPKSSLHFAYSAFSLNWLSKLPLEIMDENSPAWNEGMILYSSKRKDVLRAYAVQFADDFESFLCARKQELVSGGLVSVLVSGVPIGTSFSETSTGKLYEIFGSCFVDIANKGLIHKDKVDSFNLPAYYPSPTEIKAVVEKNGDFSIEKMEILPNPAFRTKVPDLKKRATSFRAVYEGILSKHFGSEFVDKLFKLFCKKLDNETELALFLNSEKKNLALLFVLLKLKPSPH